MLHLKAKWYTLPVAQAKQVDHAIEPTEVILLDTKLSPNWDFEAGLILKPNGEIEWVNLNAIEIQNAKDFFEPIVYPTIVNNLTGNTLFTDEELEYIRKLAQNDLGSYDSEEQDNQATTILRSSVLNKI